MVSLGRFFHFYWSQPAPWNGSASSATTADAASYSNVLKSSILPPFPSTEQHDRLIVPINFPPSSLIARLPQPHNPQHTFLSFSLSQNPMSLFIRMNSKLPQNHVTNLESGLFLLSFSVPAIAALYGISSEGTSSAFPTSALGHPTCGVELRSISFRCPEVRSPR